VEERTIKWRKKSSTVVSQIYDTGLEYCWIDKDYNQCNRFVFCKDFLQDCIWATLYNKRASIYEFEYDPIKKPRVDLECSRIALANSSDKKFSDKIPMMLSFVNHFAKRLKLRLGVIHRCTNPPKRFEKCGVYIIEGSRMWMNAPPLLSLYSLLIRVGFAHKKEKKPEETIKGVINGNIEPYGEEDAEQLMSARAGINRLLSAGYRKYFYTDIKKNYPEKESIDTLHEECGIVGFSTGCTQDIVPGWHLKKKWDVKIEEIL
jgi:hypothetical protein